MPVLTVSNEKEQREIHLPSLRSEMRERFEGRGTSALPGEKFKNVDKLEEIKYIAIFGSSGVGKTTIRNFILETSQKYGDVYGPQRGITRPPRDDNSYTHENIHTDKQTIEKLGDIGIFSHIWERKFENNREEWYCFMSPNAMDVEVVTNALKEGKKIEDIKMPSGGDSILILSSNNDFVRCLENHDHPLHAYEKNTFLLGVYCPDDEKEKRFTERKGGEKISKEEIAKRMADKSDYAIQHSHVYLQNFGEHMEGNKETNSLTDAVEVVDAIMIHKKECNEIIAEHTSDRGRENVKKELYKTLY